MMAGTVFTRDGRRRAVTAVGPVVAAVRLVSAGCPGPERTSAAARYRTGRSPRGTGSGCPGTRGTGAAVR